MLHRLFPSTRWAVAPSPLGLTRGIASSLPLHAPRKVPDAMKRAFDNKTYATLCKHIPKWDEQLIGADTNDVVALLRTLDLPPSRTLKMADAIRHFLGEQFLAALHRPDPTLVKPRRKLSESFNRAECLKEVRKYICDVITLEDRGFREDLRFQLGGVSGVMGIGKTQMLKHTATSVLPSLSKELGRSVVHIFVTFSGGSANRRAFSDYLWRHFGHCRRDGVFPLFSYADVMGSLLLRQCGDVHSVVSFAEAHERVRRVMGLSGNDVLVVLVDEIGHLGDADAKGTISALMNKMDEAKGRLVFVFTHILHSQLEAMATGSGRKVAVLPLPALDIMVWKKLPDFKAAAAKHPGLWQLCVSCCGHPRAIFEGLPRVAKERGLLDHPDEPVLIRARTSIMSECKFVGGDISTRMREFVEQWFREAVLGSPDSTHEELLVKVGLLHKVSYKPAARSHATLKFFFPLALQSWADDKFKDSSVAHYLARAYDADVNLAASNEKRMEPLMYNYEAVLHAAVGHGPSFYLRDYYKTPWIGAAFSTRLVTVDLPPAATAAKIFVEEVDDFKDPKAMLLALERGMIVVSKARREVGIEYLAPFRDHYTNKLIVACVQCKFVEKRVEWGKAKKRMKDAMRRLKPLLECECFPVYYTTANKKSFARSQFADGVYFAESDLFEFTRPLGILRMHKEKLGSVAAARYPFLKD